MGHTQSDREHFADLNAYAASRVDFDEDEEQDELHPFLKRNPRVNGNAAREQPGIVPPFIRGSTRNSSLFKPELGSSRASLWGGEQETTGRFQLLPDNGNEPNCPAVADSPTSASSEAPEQPIGAFRELRLSLGESKGNRPGGQRGAIYEQTEDAADITPRAAQVDQSNRAWFKKLVETKLFGHTVCLLVFLNALLLGAETELQWQHRQHSGDSGRVYYSNVQCAEATFCIVFVSELILRIWVDGCGFFTGHEWAWNTYDLIAVGLQVLEQAWNLCTYCSKDVQNSMFCRDTSMLRVVRITRLIRMVRLLEELRMIVASISSSMMSLGWTFLLLMMLLYSLAMFFCEVVLQNIHRAHDQDNMTHWFGGLWRTFLTMFECIFGGVSWDEVIHPLIADVSPLLGWIFGCYISFCVLAMMNMATGVFVDNAMRKAQEDKDTNTAKHISDLFFNDPELGKAETITLDQFRGKIDTPEMQDYFKAINVDPSEAEGLYRLLDADGSGSIDAAEMVGGCLRLRGQAKALELSLLMHEVSRMNKRHTDFQAKVGSYLAWIVEALDLEQRSK